MTNSEFRVGIDARIVTLDQRGFGRYARSLLKELLALPSEIQWFLYTHDPHLSRRIPSSERVEIRVVPELIGLRSHLILRSLAQKDQLNLMYFLANNYWFFPACSTLITIHDTEPFERPELYCHSLKDRLLHSLRKSGFKRIGSHFIAVSNATRQDIISILGVEPEKITTIYNGVDHSLFHPEPEPEDQKILGKYLPQPKPYIFFVGAHDYRKNLVRLIRAFDFLKKEEKIPHLLVLGGSGGPDPKFYPPLKGIAKTAPEEIIFPGYIPDSELPALYRGAELFVFPSLKEGFGLPVLEAMACGVPVISSNSSSLPEVVGDAGLLVNPEDEREIAQAILKILNSPSLAQSLREKGLKRVQSFSWRDSAQKVLEIIPQIIGR